ncbi:nuclear transport factor 2 family protein [Hymenobacter sp. RP-2-7]|uniref:Nuclear transport factor 2 family protein n=1 Tax=Hymenobacter polaris TaxID=2682546 RepID=A0A7Y0FKR7_9BACT|nr:nuclear transport factor 2 family protein [Hymenobacter polaris]NML63840.1 nuclear transport factor 2 family protein [Hymenobacter polaris]
MSVPHEIAQLERRRFDAQIARDTDALANILANDLIYTHSNGHQDSKASYLASVASGQSRYDHVDIEALTVRPYADDRTAVVNGQVRINLGPGADGQPSFIRIKYAVVYVQQPEGWRMVLWHAQKQASADPLT